MEKFLNLVRSNNMVQAVLCIAFGLFLMIYPSITVQGVILLCVQDVAEDLYAVLVSMFGEALEERAVQRSLKHLLELEDAALDALAELPW